MPIPRDKVRSSTLQALLDRSKQHGFVIWKNIIKNVKFLKIMVLSRYLYQSDLRKLIQFSKMNVGCRLGSNACIQDYKFYDFAAQISIDYHGRQRFRLFMKKYFKIRFCGFPRPKKIWWFFVCLIKPTINHLRPTLKTSQFAYYIFFEVEVFYLYTYVIFLWSKKSRTLYITYTSINRYKQIAGSKFVNISLLSKEVWQ